MYTMIFCMIFIKRDFNVSKVSKTLYIKFYVFVGMSRMIAKSLHSKGIIIDNTKEN